MKRLFLDVESTGTVTEGPLTSDVVQLGCIIDIDGEEVDRFQMKCRPALGLKTVEEGALEKTRTTREALMADDRVDAGSVLKVLDKRLAMYRNVYDKRDRFFFCGYRADFDFKLMHVMADRVGKPYFMTHFWTPPTDVMQIAAWTLAPIRHTMTDFKLHTVCRSCGVDFSETEAHDALYDIAKTRELFYKLSN